VDLRVISGLIFACISEVSHAGKLDIPKESVGFPLGSHKPQQPELDDIDCSIKTLAYEYAQQIQWWHGNFQSVYDALQLSECDNVTLTEYKSTHKSSLSLKAKNEDAVGGMTLYVDSVNGSDDNTGTETSPLQTVQAALDMTRTNKVQSSIGGNSIILRDSGIHWLSESLVLTPSDSGLNLVAYDGESPILSGGGLLDLDWSEGSPSWLEDGSTYSATLPAALDPSIVTQVFADGARAIRARHPNANPETQGLHTPVTGYFDASSGSWLAHNSEPAASEVHIDEPTRNGTTYPTYQMGYGGPAHRWEGNRSYWATSEPQGGGASTYVITSGVKFDPSLLPSAGVWGNANAEGAVVHAFHNGYWGNWQFNVNASSDPSSGELLWTEGGFQEARGRDAGAEWYIENVIELLDSPCEWFVDQATSTLYFYANDTSPPSNVIVPVLESLIELRGDMSAPITDISISGLTFRHSTSTFLSTYEVPSGGDWSSHRGAMIVVEGAENIVVESCLFDGPGGNGLLLSNYVRDTLIQRNEFVRSGDSAIVSLGTVQENDGTDGNQPRGVEIVENLAHEIGIWGKQTGFYYHGLSAQVVLKNNVAFNGPRAGINLNDGFGGGHEISGNLIFNMVRETCDHGCLNSWDRLPLLSDVNGQGSSYFPKENQIFSNFMINNYQSVWPLDHDDGSCYYNDTGNVLVYGGYKNYLGDHKTVKSNLYLYPDGSTNQFSKISCADYGSEGAGETWAGNRCIMLDGADAYDNFGCDTSNPSTKPFTANNTFYTPGAEWSTVCSTDGVTYDFPSWQALGYDIGSEVLEAPSVDEAIEWAKELLGM
jgi:hypothetical protein